jgi:phosphatidate cytidylyltransferase
LPLALLVGLFGGVGLWEWTRICGDHPTWLILGGLVVAAACASIVWLGFAWRAEVVLWLFGAVWGTDIGAYTVGKWLRGPRIAPAISPNKTWAGLAGGMVLAALWSIAWASYVDSPLALAAGYGAVAAIVAQAGDFLLSFAKRRFGVKDSSGLIPGHGGVLDRIAGLLTTGPALALLLLSTNGNV